LFVDPGLTTGLLLVAELEDELVIELCLSTPDITVVVHHAQQANRIVVEDYRPRPGSRFVADPVPAQIVGRLTGLHVELVKQDPSAKKVGTMGKLDRLGWRTIAHSDHERDAMAHAIHRYLLEGHPFMERMVRDLVKETIA